MGAGRFRCRGEWRREKMRGSLHCGGKDAAFGRDDASFGRSDGAFWNGTVGRRFF